MARLFFDNAVGRIIIKKRVRNRTVSCPAEKPSLAFPIIDRFDRLFLRISIHRGDQTRIEVFSDNPDPGFDVYCRHRL